MDEKRIAVEKIKQELIKSGKIAQEINKTVRITGMRYELPLPGRCLNMTYYQSMSENRPLMLGIHGGGFVNGGSSMDNNMWMTLCRTLNVNIASIDYRMAPEHKWPAAVLDIYDATLYLMEHVEKFHFNKDKIFIFGCSAGGNLAAAACIYSGQKGKRLYKKQILIYPCTDFTKDPFSVSVKGTGAFSPEGLLAMRELYLNPEDYCKSTASLVCASAEELKILPPAIFCLAEKDVFLQEGLQYARMLEENGIPAARVIMEGMPHAYFENYYAEHIPEILLDDLTRQALQNGTIKNRCEETLAFIKRNLQGEI